MTIGNHYFFKIRNLFRPGEINALSYYNIAHFEMNGSIRKKVRESFFALTHSSEHRNQRNIFLQEIVVSIPDCHLIKSGWLDDVQCQDMLYGFRSHRLDRQFNKVGILISSGKTVIPKEHTYTCTANLHISLDYVYLTCIENVTPEEVPLYFQSNIIDAGSLDFGSTQKDVPKSFL